MADTVTTNSEPVLNARGIPQAPFVGNVEEFIGGGSPQATLVKFQEMLAKYRYMESHLSQRRVSLEAKIPDIEKTVFAVQTLIEKHDKGQHFRSIYVIEDSLYVKADVAPLKSVYLWLGANVMLEYPTQEALEFLLAKVSAAKESLKQVREDLDFIRDQVTTMEVNTARVYNHDVKLRRKT